MDQLKEERFNIVSDMGNGIRSDEDLQIHNFKAGKLELLNRLLDPDFLQGLIEDMGDDHA